MSWEKKLEEEIKKNICVSVMLQRVRIRKCVVLASNCANQKGLNAQHVYNDGCSGLDGRKTDSRNSPSGKKQICNKKYETTSGPSLPDGYESLGLPSGSYLL